MYNVCVSCGPKVCKCIEEWFCSTPSNAKPNGHPSLADTCDITDNLNVWIISPYCNIIGNDVISFVHI